THDSDVEGLRIEQYPDIGALGRLAPLERLTLGQRSNGRRLFPVGFIEPSIDVDRSCCPLRHRDWYFGAHAVWLVGGGRRAVEPCDRGEERHQAADVEGHLRSQRAS